MPYLIKIKNVGREELVTIFDDKGMSIHARFSNEDDADTACRIIEKLRSDIAFLGTEIIKE